MPPDIVSPSLTAPMRGDEERPVETALPCPAPLSWQQVLQRFRTESDSWTVDCGVSSLSGRTWGDGPPVYFLNGLGGTHELFALTVWLLRESHRCIVFDYPDRSSISNPLSKPSAKLLADDLLAVADKHGDKQFSLFATSFGSLVALTAMRLDAGRIERAVLQTAFAHRSLSWFERLLIRVGRRLPGTLDRVPWRRPLQQQTHRAWFPPFDRSRWQFFLENTGEVRIAALARRAEIVRHTDLRPELTNLPQPVLLVRCEGDGRVAEQCGRELDTGLPNSRVEYLATCGQLPYLTHPHQLANVIKSFLDE